MKALRIATQFLTTVLLPHSASVVAGAASVLATAASLAIISAERTGE